MEETRSRLGLYSRLWHNERCRFREQPIDITPGSVPMRIQIHQTPKTGSKQTTFLKNFNEHTRKISRLSKSSASIVQSSLVVCQGFRSTVRHEDLRQTVANDLLYLQLVRKTLNPAKSPLRGHGVESHLLQSS